MRNCVVVNLLVNNAAEQEKVTKGIYMRKRCRSVWFCLQLEFLAELRYLVADCIYLFYTRLHDEQRTGYNIGVSYMGKRKRKRHLTKC